MIRILFVVSILMTNNFADDFANYLENKFINKKETIKDKSIKYNIAYTKALQEYKKNIKQNFPNIDITHENLWVQYTNQYTQKKMIDYKNSKIIFNVVAKSEKHAQNQILKLYDELYFYDVKKAFSNDFLERKVTKNLDDVLEVPNENQKLVSDIISKEEYKRLREQLILKPFSKIEYNDKLVYKVEIDLPTSFKKEKAILYKEYILVQSDKLNIEASLIYAIIDVNSGFNPMSKTNTPSFGLMQIQPKKSGVIAYKYLTAYTKYLSSNYLYNTKNNIELGSTYLKILFYDDLININNFKSRWYCTIVSYKVGSENLAKAFSKNGNIKDAINIMNTVSSDQVYKRLMKKLPNRETRTYLFKVLRLIKKYKRLLGTNKI